MIQGRTLKHYSQTDLGFDTDSTIYLAYSLWKLPSLSPCPHWGQINVLPSL